MGERIADRVSPRLEFLGNSLTKTNQTKQNFNRLYYFDCLIQIVQFDEQNKSLTNVLCPNITV